jgi:hypothetical protein
MERISFHEIDSWVERKLAKKYRDGLNRILKGFQPVLMVLSKVENSLLTIGGCITGLQSDICSIPKSDSQFSISNADICKFTIDKILQSMEFVSEFTDLADNRSFLRVTRLCKDFKELLTGGLRTLQSFHIYAVNAPCADAVRQIMEALTDFNSTIAKFELIQEETRHFTEHMGTIKDKILGEKFISIPAERAAVVEARQAVRVYNAVRSKYDHARQCAEEVCTDPRLKEGRKLEAERDELASGMDAVLSPFVRISHNLQGKGGSLVTGGDLTPDEAACVRKYTGILVRPDMYELLEEEGSIENLLEALFLLGIASGVGTDPAPQAVVTVPSGTNSQVSSRVPPPAGLSRKSQALLTDALNKFQADRLRCSHADWLDRRRRLADLECCPDYQSCRAAAAAAAAALLEEAKALDSASSRIREAEDRGRRAALTLVKFQEHVQSRYVTLMIASVLLHLKNIRWQSI